VTSLEDGDQFDPEFLDSLRSRASAFTLGDGARTSLSLPLDRVTP